MTGAIGVESLVIDRAVVTVRFDGDQTNLPDALVASPPSEAPVSMGL